MNRMRPSAWLLVVLLPLGCDTPTESPRLPRVHEIPLHIPSDNETVFAETRDFTVVGYFDVPLSQPGDVRIELFAGASAAGAPLRTIESRVNRITGVTPRSSLDFSYEAGQAWGPLGPLTNSALVVMSPDLVAVPGGIANSTNKVVVTNEYYAGVILGGVTRDFDTDYADDGVPLVDLTAGTYTLRVTGISGQLDGLTATKTVEFGITHAMLGRFSPDANRDALLDFAAANGYRTYIDFFPGFFSHRGYSYEIPARWMANNSVEVVNTSPAAIVDGVAVARNDVLLYNISPASATNRIEIGSLVANRLLDDATTFHHYDIGEPSITWSDAATGEQLTLQGVITRFGAGDRLVLTRAEIRDVDDVDHNNRSDAGSTQPLTIDVDLADGIDIRGDVEFSVHGVVTPIPATVRPADLAHQYEIENGIDSIRYVLMDPQGASVLIRTRAVGLDRRYDPVQMPDRLARSVYEFAHEFHVVASQGVYTLALEGLDRQGQAVSGTAAQLTIRIAAEPVTDVTPTPPPDRH